jgi:cytochrome c oxidase subunit IV
MATVADHASHKHISVTTYVMVFLALMVLLVITVWAAFVHIPGPGVGLAVALLIATIKTVLVVLYFMHVIYSSKLTKVFVAAAFFWFGILLVLLYSDYLTRPWLGSSRGWNENPAMIDGGRDHVQPSALAPAPRTAPH